MVKSTLDYGSYALSTERPTSIQPEIQQTIANLLHFTVSSTLVTNRYTYSAWGRQITAVDGRGNTTTTEYNALGQIIGTENAAGNRTTYVYDALGRQIAVSDPLTNTTYTAYDGLNNIIAQWGAVYPVTYEYDTQGRMVALYTYRGTNEINSQSEILNLKSEMDCTRWHYDAVTGLLTQHQKSAKPKAQPTGDRDFKAVRQHGARSGIPRRSGKLYADGKGISYTYTPQGRLATRTWARGITTSYTYDSLGQLTHTSYSDDTPDIIHSYDRLGREIVTWSDNSKTQYAYNSLDLLSETTIDVDKIRRAEASELAGKGLIILKNLRYAFLKRPENLTDKQRDGLQKIINKRNLKTVRSYHWKESFRLFWEYKQPHAASKYLRRWCRGANMSRLQPIKTFVKTLRQHEALILNWFRAKKQFSSGAVEAVNRGAGLVSNLARGFRTPEMRKIALFHAFGDLPMPSEHTHRFS